MVQNNQKKRLLEKLTDNLLGKPTRSMHEVINGVKESIAAYKNYSKEWDNLHMNDGSGGPGDIAETTSIKNPSDSVLKIGGSLAPIKQTPPQRYRPGITSKPQPKIPVMPTPAPVKPQPKFPDMGGAIGPVTPQPNPITLPGYPSPKPGIPNNPPSDFKLPPGNPIKKPGLPSNPFPGMPINIPIKPGDPIRKPGPVIPLPVIPKPYPGNPGDMFKKPSYIPGSPDAENYLKRLFDTDKNLWAKEFERIWGKPYEYYFPSNK